MRSTISLTVVKSNLKAEASEAIINIVMQMI
jgi:hypothetical protein